MKLLHFSTEKHWRGGEQQIAYLVEELNHTGIENFLICRKDSEMQKYAKQKNIPHSAIAIRNSIDISAIAKVAKLFNEQKADFVHLHTSKAHSIGLFANLISNKQKFILHRRVSYTIKQSSINKWKYSHSSIKKIVCISQDVKKQVELIVKDESKLSVIYSGIDLSKFKEFDKTQSLKKELNIPEKHFLITGVGALSPEKDFETFIRTAAETIQKNEQAHFLIVGKGEEEQKLKLLVKDLKIEDKLTFAGFRTDVPQILQASHVFMLCSSSEGLGTSFIDAAAAGCALIGTDAGGIPEIIEQGVNGYFEHIGDYKAMSKRLIELLENEYLLQQMSLKAKEKAQKFSIKQMTYQYLSLYKQLNKDD
jgi:glycosyltransferase involved in cell wall biosynthesis